LSFRRLCGAQGYDAIFAFLTLPSFLTVCFVFGGVWLVGVFGGPALGAAFLVLALLCFAAALDAAWRWPHCHYGAEQQRTEHTGNHPPPDPSTVAIGFPRLSRLRR